MQLAWIKNFKILLVMLHRYLPNFLIIIFCCLEFKIVCFIFLQASRLGGSYDDEELTFNMASGTRLNLHMSKVFL